MIKNYKNFIKESSNDEVRDINWFIKENNIALDVTELNCSYNRLTSLHGIEKLTKLTELYCFKNKLTSLTRIDKLQNLSKLNCSYNNLTNLYEIKKLTNLTLLNCSYNYLVSLNEIEKLTKLTKLYCYNNNLVSLYGIEKLVNLTEIYFNNNNLPNYSTNIKKLKQQLKLEQYNYGIAEQAIEMGAPIIDKTTDKWYELSKIEKPNVITKDGKKIDILDIKLIDEGEELS